MKKHLHLTLAALGTCALMGTAQAAIIHTALAQPYGIGDNELLELDFNGDTFKDLMLSVDGGGSANFDGGRQGNNGAQSAIVNLVYTGTVYNPAIRYDAGVSIAGSPTIANTGTFWFPAVSVGQFHNMRGYAGVVLKTGTFNNGSGFTVQETRYGWIDLEVTDSTVSRLKVHGWAFESTPGAAILTGPLPSASNPDSAGTVPEPSSYALAMTGLAALGMAGRRRTAARRST